MQTNPILGASSGFAFELPTHRNPGLEIVVIEEGVLDWHIDGAPYRVSPGTAFFTFPWEEHGSLAEREPGHQWSFVLLNVGRETVFSKHRLSHVPIFGNNPEGAQILAEIRSASVRAVSSGARLPNLIRWSAEEFRNKGRDSRSVLKCLAQWSLIELARCLRDRESRSSRNVAHPAVDRFLKELPDRLDHPWTLEEMARTTRLGRTHFSNTVRTITGDTPMEHLQRLRIGRAQQLLRSTKLCITEIAMTCGFSTSQHFARIFLHFSGKTASAYREQFQYKNSAATGAAR